MMINERKRERNRFNIKERTEPLEKINKAFASYAEAGNFKLVIARVKKKQII